jgi:hypothetical protein
MLSQLTKTLKMALKSSERAILRARSALQRFPVVEWRQRMEDFHKRSINISRSLAGADAWRESDCDGGGVRPMVDTDDWNPENQVYPSQPEWDNRSINESPHAHTPGTPGQWSQDALTPTGDHLHAPDNDYFNIIASKYSVTAPKTSLSTKLPPPSKKSTISLPPPSASTSNVPPKPKRAPKKITISLPSLTATDDNDSDDLKDAGPAAKKPRLESGAGSSSLLSMLPAPK